MMTTEVKIIKQSYLTPQGERTSYGIIVNSMPRCVFYSIDELNAFLMGLNGN